MFSSSTTVGEAMAEEERPRGCLWVRAVLLPFFFFAMAMGMLYGFYRADTVRVASDPWRLLVLLPWAPYLVLGDVIVSYMDLFLPLAPFGPRNALIVVTGAGFLLLLMMAMVVFLYGHASAVIALICIFAVALAGLLAFWLWLHRTYRSSS